MAVPFCPRSIGSGWEGEGRVWENKEKYRLEKRWEASFLSTGQGKGNLSANHGADGGGGGGGGGQRMNTARGRGGGNFKMHNCNRWEYGKRYGT